MVYVSSLFEGVKCIDVENLLNPVFVGEYDLPGRAYDLALVGDFVYVANSLYGLQIINVSNPSNPFLVSYPTATYTPNSVYSITKHENILYCAGNNDGLFIADISDPTDPVFYPNLTHHPDSRFATDPIVIDNTLIVEDRNWNEILTFDISNPTSPILTNCYSWNLSIKNWVYYDNLLVTANGYNGVTLLDTQGVTPVHQTAIVPSYNQIHNYPNPFNPSTTISFNLTAKDAEDAKVEIFNVKGQKIKELKADMSSRPIRQLPERGEISHTITWDGTNAESKPVSSGVYFYKVVTSKATIMKKMLLLK
jgi:hypothetical protein